ncbi:MAG: efflux RND transporter periplasmic adaptor subunit [Candidatus Omnitrophota bacterium]
MLNTKSQKLKLRNFDRWLLLVIFCLVLGILSGCQGRQVEKVEEPESIPVKVLKVKLQELSELLEYVGDIRAQDEAMVYPKVSGKIIEKVKEDGSPVEKGGVIAYIDRDEVGLKFEKAPVESPLSGIIGRVYVDIGQNVSAQTPIALVVNMDKVKINLDIPEKYLPRVSLEQQALIGVDAYPKQEFLGVVTKISPVVDLTTRSFPVEITLANTEHLLKSGMFAKVRLILKEHQDVAVVLKEAVMGKEPNFYVYVIEDNKAVLRKVSLGIRQGEYFEVRDGLKEGDLVVVMGQQSLKDNARVSMEIEDSNTE